MKTAADRVYNQESFHDQQGGSLASARGVMPVVLGLVPARSVVDFGCWHGTWLRACLENGVEKVLGLDGEYVNPQALMIDRGDFRAVNLEKPIRLDRAFDLALCLEVAEHLPKRAARNLVESLAAAAPSVLFSAALPGQGGTNHVNEQWPPYWQRLFSEFGMRRYDVVRPLIWRDRSIAHTYRQNIYLYTKGERSEFEGMDSFEPQLTLISNAVMGHTTFNWSVLALKFMPTLHRIHAILSRLTPQR